MLSALPKLADRSFILGFFLPSLLFALAVLALFSDQPGASKLLANLGAKDPGSAVFVLVSVWVLGVVMLTLNHPLYRMLEGYGWPRWLAELARRRYRDRLVQGQRELRTLFRQWARDGGDFPKERIDRYRTLKIELAGALPSSAADVMPTAFGNAIKAFEVYPRDIYGADGPPVWPRLA